MVFPMCIAANGSLTKQNLFICFFFLMKFDFRPTKNQTDINSLFFLFCRSRTRCDRGEVARRREVCTTVSYTTTTAQSSDAVVDCWCAL